MQYSYKQWLLLLLLPGGNSASPTHQAARRWSLLCYPHPPQVQVDAMAAQLGVGHSCESLELQQVLPWVLLWQGKHQSDTGN